MLLFLYMVVSLRNTSNYWKDLQYMPKQGKLAYRIPPQSPKIPPGTYYCENILDLKIERGQRFYLIKWKGYDNLQDNTWEPLCNLEEYMLEDLLDYEVDHAEEIRKVEDHWQEIYREGKVSERLQKLNIKEMRERLNRIMEQSQSEESIPIQPSRNTRMHKNLRKHKDHHSHKVKQIAKIKDSSSHSTSKKRELRRLASVKIENTTEPKTKKNMERRSQVKMEERDGKSEREYLKKRGRRPYRSTIIPKYQQDSDNLELQVSLQQHQLNDGRDIASLSQDSPIPHEVLSKEESQQHYFTPERGANLNNDEAKKTKSQQRSVQNEQSMSQKRAIEGTPLEQDEQDEQDKDDFVDQSQHERQKLNHQINSYFQDFGVENSVAEVLSRRITPPSSPLKQPEKRDSLSILKKMSLHKTNEVNYIGNNRGGCNFSLHPSTKKFIMQLKNKSRTPERMIHESQPEPPPSIIKHLPNSTIVELDQEQKESSPISSVKQHDQEAEKEVMHNWEEVGQAQAVHQQHSSHPQHNDYNQHIQQHSQHLSHHSQHQDQYASLDDPPSQHGAHHSQQDGHLSQHSNHLSQHSNHLSEHEKQLSQHDHRLSQHDDDHSHHVDHSQHEGDYNREDLVPYKANHSSLRNNRQDYDRYFHEGIASYYESRHKKKNHNSQKLSPQEVEHANRRRTFLIKRLKQMRKNASLRKNAAIEEDRISEASLSQSHPPDIVQRLCQNEVPNEVEPKENQPKDLDNINAILDNFQHKSNIQEGPLLQQPSIVLPDKKEAEMINIDDDSNEKQLKSRSHPFEGHKFCVIPDKSKRIKKQPKEGLRRGIVGRSEESLVQEGEGTLHYRPSLNTLFQSMLSAREVQLLQSPKVVQLTSSFRLENVIIFSAQVQTAPENQPETRFISYQTLRDHFPRELLTFLEDNGMIQL